MASRPEVAPRDDPAPMWPRPFQVRRQIRETADSFDLVLEASDGEESFAFQAGQFNMLYAFGVGEAPISISGDPARSGQLVHTIRAVGNVTRALQKLRRGDPVGVRGPFGQGWPVAEAQGHDVVVVAGGIGLAPLRPVLYHLLSQRALYGRVVLLYGARTPGDLLYPRELREWRGRFDVEVAVTVDRAGSDWQGAVGVVSSLLDRARFEVEGAMAFVCGPEVMMRFSAMALRKRGLAESAIFVSLERNMTCGVGLCGHCQYGPYFLCRDGPVLRYDTCRPYFGIREV